MGCVKSKYHPIGEDQSLVKKTINPHDAFDYTFKMIIVGDSSVGKTSLLNRMIHDTYVPVENMTVGVDLKTKLINLQDDVDILVRIWDTAGQEQFHSIVRPYFRNTDIALVVFDVSNRKSFDNLDRWIPDILSENENAEIHIVANKCDVSDFYEITRKDIAALREKWKYPIEFISCKTNKNLPGFIERILEKKIDN